MDPFNPVGAIGLMPYDSFAQRRADDQQMIQQQAGILALAQDRASREAAAKKELNSTFALASQIDALAPDRARIVGGIVNPWRKKIADTIKNEYGGSVIKFQQQSGEAMLGQFMDELATSPILANAEENKLKYAQYQKNQEKGFVHRGDADQAWLNFKDGVTPTFDYKGGYERPKSSMLDFAKTEHPDYQYGMVDSLGRRRAPDVTPDQYAATLNLPAADAADWMYGKGGYQKGMKWGMKDLTNLDKQQLAEREFKNKVNQQNIDNGISAGQLGVARGHLRVAEYNAMKENNKDADAAEKARVAALPAVSWNPTIYGDQVDPITGQVKMGSLAKVGSVKAYERPMNDAGMQKRLGELVGAIPAERVVTDPYDGKQHKVTRNEGGKPIFEVSTGAILDGKNPYVRYENNGAQGGKFEAFDIDYSKVVSLDPDKVRSGAILPTRSNSYLRAKAVVHVDGERVVKDVLLPIDGSEDARAANDQRDMMFDKPDQKKTLAELYRQAEVARQQQARTAAAAAGQPVAPSPNQPNYFPK